MTTKSMWPSNPWQRQKVLRKLGSSPPSIQQPALYSRDSHCPGSVCTYLMKNLSLPSVTTHCTIHESRQKNQFVYSERYLLQKKTSLALYFSSHIYNTVTSHLGQRYGVRTQIRPHIRLVFMAAIASWLLWAWTWLQNLSRCSHYMTAI